MDIDVNEVRWRAQLVATGGNTEGAKAILAKAAQKLRTEQRTLKALEAMLDGDIAAIDRLMEVK